MSDNQGARASDNPEPDAPDKGELSDVSAVPGPGDRPPGNALIPQAPRQQASDLAALLADPEIRADVEGAYALNTMRAYRADWADWAAWCARRGARALPADDRALRDYLADLSAGKKLSTLKRRLAAISRAHRLAGYQLDRMAPAVYHVMRRLARAKAAPSAGRAELLTPDIVAMLKAAGDGIRGLRDRAIILIGFAAGLRRGEIVALNVNDLDWKRDGVLIQIRKSKTDQEGEGQSVLVCYGKRETTCPVRALKKWIDRAVITRGPIFRPVARDNAVVTGRLSDKAVWRIVKKHAIRAGLDPSRLGAHSLRVGHVTQALRNGAEPTDAQAQLRHTRLETTLGYDRQRGRTFKQSSSGKLGL